MTVTLLQGDARALPLPDASIDLIVTSPPFWGLRSYTDGGEHYDGQIGAEPTPADYLSNLIDCTREWLRVLKPTGSLWVNLGDKYARPGGGVDKVARTLVGAGRGATARRPTPAAGWDGPREKSLLGLPWRYAIRCTDELELILRAEVIWSKPNGLPESVTDRVRRAHETWFHLVKSRRYFAAVDAIREPAGAPKTRGRNPNGPAPDSWDRGLPTLRPNPLGKLPGSVREVATQPLRVPAALEVDHFAAFPMEWPRWIISGWSPSGICTTCGEGRKPIADRGRVADRPGRVQGRSVDALLGGHGSDGRAGSRFVTTVTITGEECACPDAGAPTVPAVVLDPFGGTGTTALVADVLGRHGISVDMSADYCRLAAWRTSDQRQIANARRRAAA